MPILKSFFVVVVLLSPTLLTSCTCDLPICKDVMYDINKIKTDFRTDVLHEKTLK